ncbi:zinc finger protein 112-like [Zerene cesonia]|uniref:zinc finger protein 112-like n=1 Tax=Zerene cesonia TaxID=33412 RepID=UPI0018E5500F|nr:zinc finger protein 112-like [Zerene cesonia]
MEQGIDDYFRTVCSACLSSDRDIITINSSSHLYQIFRLLLCDNAGDRIDDALCPMEIALCWECHAILLKCAKFRKKVQNAQEHLRVLALSQSQESLDHTYMSQSLSTLECVIKRDYDRLYIDYTGQTESQWVQPYITITTPQAVKNEDFDVSLRDHISLAIDERISQVPELDIKNPLTGEITHIVVGTDALVSSADFSNLVKGESAEFAVDTNSTQLIVTDLNKRSENVVTDNKCGYDIEYMLEGDMLACREELKKKVTYANAVYKCELCIMEFYLQQQVEDHFIAAHRARPNATACKICYVYVDDDKLQEHTDGHYTRYTCRMCGRAELSERLVMLHVQTHLAKKRRKKKNNDEETQPKPGDLRKLLSKTTIVGYKCLECDMFFKNCRARKNHVARFHREGLQCDHCKKRFVNKTTLATHLNHVPNSHLFLIPLNDKSQNRGRTAFASQLISVYMFYRYPCPMCNKGYPTREAMQDHFNYQHLGKTTHKCPICNKPIASKANVEKHIMRVHREKKEKPKNHICNQCGKGFSDRKALNQHAAIHSGERPLSCDICAQTFKQKASLYTHKKRVHKILPPRKVVEFMEKGEGVNT